MFNEILQPLVLLSLTSTVLTSVVTLPRSERLFKKDVNLNLQDFEDLTVNGLTTDQLEQLFRADMDGAIALAFGAQNALQISDVEDTPEFIRWFGSGASTDEVNQILRTSSPCHTKNRTLIITCRGFSKCCRPVQS